MYISCQVICDTNEYHQKSLLLETEFWGFLPSCSRVSGCTTKTLMNKLKRFDENYTRMLHAILNKSCKQHATKQLYRPLILQNHPAKIRHTKHCGRSRSKLISHILLWTPTHGHTNVVWPGKTDIHHYCVDTGCHLEDKSGVMVDRKGWQDRAKEIHAISMTWGWHKLSNICKVNHSLLKQESVLS